MVSFLAAVMVLLLSVAMVALYAWSWHEDYWRLGKSLTTFVVSLGIVVVYCGILVTWFWHMIPIAAAHI